MGCIHPSALVEPGAQVAADVDIGPFCTVGAQVRIGAGTRLISHVVLDGWTEIGGGCTLFPFASVGLRTQDKKFAGGTPRVRIGDRTTIREGVTIHAATRDGDYTSVGSDCLIMAYAHIAHDCVVGDGVIIANAGTLAGHVVVEDRAIIGGLCGIHQFARLGRLCITGGCSKVTQDIPPFMMADGNPLKVHTINKIGLERAGVDERTQGLIKQAFRILYRENLTTTKALEKIEKTLELVPEIEALVRFIRSSERGITR
jgi:UDP-N-acetylglucosamine acyltransferase